MKALKKIAQGFKEVFEGNRCRFADRCELYQVKKKCPKCKGSRKGSYVYIKPPLSIGFYDNCSVCNGIGSVEGVVCNDRYQRFPNGEKAYCGKYRELEEDEEKE